MVAWLAKVPVFHSVNLALSANGGSNPARDVYMVPWPLLLIITRHNGTAIFIIDMSYGVMVYPWSQRYRGEALWTLSDKRMINNNLMFYDMLHYLNKRDTTDVMLIYKHAKCTCALKKMSTLFMLSVKISKKFEFSFQTNKYLLT